MKALAVFCAILAVSRAIVDDAEARKAALRHRVSVLEEETARLRGLLEKKLSQVNAQQQLLDAGKVGGPTGGGRMLGTGNGSAPALTFQVSGFV
jgi:hypothetical protein